MTVHGEAGVADVSFRPIRAQWVTYRANLGAREENPLVVAADTVEQHELRGDGRCPAVEWNLNLEVLI